ncbi:hypothetical protein AWB64_02680 [Caballeronia sordidicola]|uniref:Uncharacterized protein n=1 Tax=Caballeronia sordidicola TaxID=196367 RepID=A0A158GEQ6_CABSO|nr:hypothetical protein AWB64_02680 [Caballeronia sordidicola]
MDIDAKFTRRSTAKAYQERVRYSDVRASLRLACKRLGLQVSARAHLHRKDNRASPPGYWASDYSNLSEFDAAWKPPRIGIGRPRAASQELSGPLAMSAQGVLSRDASPAIALHSRMPYPVPSTPKCFIESWPSLARSARRKTALPFASSAIACPVSATWAQCARLSVRYQKSCASTSRDFR